MNLKNNRKEASTTADVKDKSARNMNPLQRFVKMLSDIFVPIIPAIVAGGLLMGINNILTAPDLFYDNKSLIDVHSQFAGLADMINIFVNAPFTLLPILIDLVQRNDLEVIHSRAALGMIFSTSIINERIRFS